MKLTQELADEIRASDLPAKQVAGQYGISTAMVYDIKNHRAWTDNPQPRGPKGRPRKPVVLNPCGCGCGTLVKNRYAPGHNAKIQQTIHLAQLACRKTPEQWLAEALANATEEDRGHDSPCLIWQRTVDPKSGYGHTTRHENGRKVTTTAHRRVWEATHDVELPRELDVDHLCRQRDCINIEHLEPVTRAENIRRASKLTHEDVEEIRTSDLSNIELAEKFGMHKNSIGNIRRGDRWAA